MTSGPASQEVWSSVRLRSPGAVRESPTNTATVKRELVFTTPSSAVTCILVVSPLSDAPVWLE